MKPLCPRKICGRTSKVLISITTISISWAMGGGSPPGGLAPRGHLVKIVDETMLYSLFDVGGMFCEDCWCWWIFLSFFIWCWWNVFVTCAHLQKRIDRICPEKLRPRVRPALSYDLDLCRLEPLVQDKSGTFWSQLGGEQRLTDYRGRQECRLAQVHWFLWYPICNTYHWYNFWIVKS